MRKFFLALLATLWPLIAFAQTVPAPQGMAALVCAYNSSPPTLSSGTFGYVQCDSSGRVVTSIVINSTQIIGGTNTRILYDNNGTVGEYPITGTGSVVMSASPTLSPAANSAGLTISGGSIIGSSTVAPGISITGTLNTSGVVDGVAIFANITNTASGANSLVYDWQIGGVSKGAMDMSGVAYFGASPLSTNASYMALNASTIGLIDVNRTGSGTLNDFIVGVGGNRSFSVINSSPRRAGLPTDGGYGWSIDGSPNNTAKAQLTSPATATVHFGAADAASPVAQTLGVQGVVAGTSNTAGASFTIAGSQGTGTGAGGSIIFQTAPAGLTGTAQNALATAFSITSAGNIAFPSDNVFVIGTNGNQAQTIYGHTLQAGGSQLFNSGVIFGTGGQITGIAANHFNIGTSDSATPSAQTVGFQNGSGTNIAGANATVVGSLSTGTAASGDIIFQTGVKPNVSGGTQATATTALTLKGETQLVVLNAITSDATHTDATICEDTTTHALYSGSGTLGICLGTSSRRYKHDEADLGLGRVEIMGLRPKSYRLNASHGDPSKFYYGFMAEDAISVLPGLVGLDADGRPNTMDYLGVVPVLTRAFQEHDETIGSLKARVAALEATLERRTAWIDTLLPYSPVSPSVARPLSLH